MKDNINLENFNSGFHNDGYQNIGDRNIGNQNIGNQNIGDVNIGDANIGNRNIGTENIGDWNFGNKNKGNQNLGNKNNGECNSGNSNTGSWNLGSNNKGFFNTKTPEFITVFNKPCLREVWDAAEKPKFIYNVTYVKWIFYEETTIVERMHNPKLKETNGYLRVLSLEEAWEEAIEEASKRDIELLKALPNFDSDVFFEITKYRIK